MYIAKKKKKKKKISYTLLSGGLIQQNKIFSGDQIEHFDIQFWSIYFSDLGDYLLLGPQVSYYLLWINWCLYPLISPTNTNKAF